MARAARVLSESERLDWLCLSRSENVGPATFRDLLGIYGSAGAALAALPQLARRGGRRSRIKLFPRAAGEDELAALAQRGGRLIALSEPEYPLPLAATVDAPPLIAFTRPGRDIQRQPEGAVEFQLAANDDLGLGEVKMLAQVNQGDESITIQNWPNDQLKPRRRALVEFKKTIDELGLRGGDQMQYWATVVDRNPAAPGSAQTRKFNIIVLTAEQA
ncbi:MAG: hypothetical protein QF827_01100, partial [Alphaproteobacteria bacterium]|nr:hypothetical protein [Alphaproteobacteria bacterium]